MATLKEVKQRIQGIRSTQKITKAMKIVAATKLKVHERRKKQAALFSAKIDSLLQNIIQYSYHAQHPLLSERRAVGTGGIVIIGSDRGLCGSFNTNLFRKALDYIEEQKQCARVVLVPLGKRTYNYFKKTQYFFMKPILKSRTTAFLRGTSLGD